MTTIMLAGLLKLELPGHTVRLCDGGTLVFAGETYTGRDSLLGVIGELEAASEGVGGGMPDATITFLPPDETSAAVMMDPAWQSSRCRTWIAEVDQDTGLILGNPDQQADWVLDATSIIVGVGKRALEVTFAGLGERLTQINRGNGLSPSFHRCVHPGEAGLDNASGVATAVPWGAPSAPRGQALAGGYTSGGTLAGIGKLYDAGPGGIGLAG